MSTSTVDRLREELQAAIQAHYMAANPSESVQRRETHPSDMERRQARVRRLKANVELAVRNLRHAAKGD